MSQVRLHQEIAGYQFEGPYMSLRRIPQGNGIYAIVSYDGKQYYLLDVAYAKNIKNSCQVNPRKDCWEQFKQGNILFAFLQNKDLDVDAYRLIVEEIRKRYEKIPCGNPKTL
ncbi:hypothetical protein ACFL0D_03410 [Thermoproteota archaeon]